MKRVSISEIVEKPVSGEWGNEAENSSDGIPVIRNTNFSDDGRIDLQDVAYRKISERKITKKKLKPGDIIIEKSGGSENQPVGRVVYFDIDDGKNYLFSNFTSALRPKEEVEPKYVHYALLHSYQRGGSELFQNKTTGIRNLQLDRYLDKIDIPLPSLSEQKAIVAKLDRAQRLIDIDREMLAKYDELIQSVFLEMFGDPVRNEKGWEVKKLGDVGTLARGKSKHRPRNDPSILGGDYPLIQTGDVANAGLFITDYSSTYNEAGLKQSKLWDKGTLCITIAANIAKVGILDFDACFPDSVVGFKSEKASSIFVYSWMGFLQNIIEEQAPVSAQKNINLRILNDLDIIFPSLDLQNEFEKIVLKIDRERREIEELNQKSEELFSSLVQGVFG